MALCASVRGARTGGHARAPEVAFLQLRARALDDRGSEVQGIARAAVAAVAVVAAAAAAPRALARDPAVAGEAGRGFEGSGLSAGGRERAGDGAAEQQSSSGGGGSWCGGGGGDALQMLREAVCAAGLLGALLRADRAIVLVIHGGGAAAGATGAGEKSALGLGRLGGRLGRELAVLGLLLLPGGGFGEPAQRMGMRWVAVRRGAGDEEEAGRRRRKGGAARSAGAAQQRQALVSLSLSRACPRRWTAANRAASGRGRRRRLP